MKPLVALALLAVALGPLAAQEQLFTDTAMPFLNPTKARPDHTNYSATDPLNTPLVAPGIEAWQVELEPTAPPGAEPIEEKDMPMCGQRVGYVLDAPADIMETAPWHTLPNGGRICRIELRSVNAAALRLNFDKVNEISGLELRVYAPGELAVHGPYKFPLAWPQKDWWAPTIFGERIGLEFYLPPGTPQPDDLPSLIKVAYTQCAFGPGTTLTCHNDATCDANFATEAAGVARITMINGGGCGACSGSVLNRSPGDFAPLFLTADHCGVANQAVAATVEFFWFFQTPNCGGAAPNPNNVPRTIGALALSTGFFEDTTLLGMYSEPPAGVAYLGWAMGGFNTGTAITGIHHPRGTFKRISYGTYDSNDNYNMINVGNKTGFTTTLNNGIIEPGSSGSPLLDANRRVRGPLSAGTPGCPSMVARYGRMDLLQNHFSPHLIAPASPVYVRDLVNSTQAGTLQNPFRTLFEATFSVRANDTIWIHGGTYFTGSHFYPGAPTGANPETNLGAGLRIGRPMTLRAYNGLVRIQR